MEPSPSNNILAGAEDGDHDIFQAPQDRWTNYAFRASGASAGTDRL